MKYFLNNSFINVIYGIPVIVFILYYCITTGINSFYKNDPIIVLIIGAIVPLLIFIITSFKYTRFLGEPERYTEFGIPLYSVVFILFFLENQVYMVILVVISFLLILYHFSVFFHQNENELSLIAKVSKSKINETYPDKKEISIFSNNIAYLNFFIDENKYKILTPDLTSLKTFKYSMNEMYPHEFPVISPFVIPDLLEHYDIDFFILEEERLSEKELNNLVNVRFRLSLIDTYKNVKLYKREKNQ
jgi:hypothetical protein